MIFLLHASVLHMQISIKGSLLMNRIVTVQPLIVPIPGPGSDLTAKTKACQS